MDKRISRRGVDMGDAATGIFKSDYEPCGIKWRAQRSNKPDCLKNILCNCERRRCPGRTVTHAYYTRKLQES